MDFTLNNVNFGHVNKKIGLNVVTGSSKSVVMFDNGIYKMWYIDTSIRQIYTAISIDGNNWAQKIIPSLNNQVNKDSLTVISVNDIFYMFFVEQKVLHLAVSRDGIDWKNCGVIIEESTLYDNIISCSVTRANDKLKLLYTVSKNGEISTYIATIDILLLEDAVLGIR